jgi:hypothetical protein
MRKKGIQTLIACMTIHMNFQPTWPGMKKGRRNYVHINANAPGETLSTYVILVLSLLSTGILTVGGASGQGGCACSHSTRTAVASSSLDRSHQQWGCRWLHANWTFSDKA